MIHFLQSFQKPFSRISENILLPLATLYTSNKLSAAFARACMFMRYPAIFPVFKNNDFAKIKWKGNHQF